MIEFTTVSGDKVVGVVATRDGELLSDPGADSTATTWLDRGGDPADFETRYDGWTNGYVLGRRVDDNADIITTLHVVESDEPALTADAKPGDQNNIKDYWTKDPRGLAKWVDKPHPWTALYHHLRKHMPDEMAKRVASEWYHEVKGHWPNEGKKK